MLSPRDELVIAATTAALLSYRRISILAAIHSATVRARTGDRQRLPYFIARSLVTSIGRPGAVPSLASGARNDWSALQKGAESAR